MPRPWKSHEEELFHLFLYYEALAKCRCDRCGERAKEVTARGDKLMAEIEAAKREPVNPEVGQVGIKHASGFVVIDGGGSACVH